MCAYTYICTYKTTMVMKSSNFDANRFLLKAGIPISSNYSRCIRTNKQCADFFFEGAHPYHNALAFSRT